MELKLCQSSLPLPFKSSSFTPNSIYNHFTLLPKRCKYHIQELFSNGQHMNISKQFLVHVVKEDETLTSISKLYGVHIYEIAAANKEIIHVDLVFEGQHVNIPSYVTASSQTAKTSGYFLVLVPLIAFCIKCIMNVFHHRVARNKLQDVRQASGSMRWKLALHDLSDPDASYSESRPEI